MIPQNQQYGPPQTQEMQPVQYQQPMQQQTVQEQQLGNYIQQPMQQQMQYQQPMQQPMQYQQPVPMQQNNGPQPHVWPDMNKSPEYYKQQEMQQQQQTQYQKPVILGPNQGAYNPKPVSTVKEEEKVKVCNIGFIFVIVLITGGEIGAAIAILNGLVIIGAVLLPGSLIVGLGLCACVTPTGKKARYMKLVAWYWLLLPLLAAFIVLIAMAGGQGGGGKHKGASMQCGEAFDAKSSNALIRCCCKDCHGVSCC